MYRMSSWIYKITPKIHKITISIIIIAIIIIFVGDVTGPVTGPQWRVTPVKACQSNSIRFPKRFPERFPETIPRNDVAVVEGGRRKGVLVVLVRGTESGTTKIDLRWTSIITALSEAFIFQKQKFWIKHFLNYSHAVVSLPQSETAPTRLVFNINLNVDSEIIRFTMKRNFVASSRPACRQSNGL